MERPARHRLGPHGRPGSGGSATRPPRPPLPSRDLLSPPPSQTDSPRRGPPPTPPWFKPWPFSRCSSLSLFSHQVETRGESVQQQTRKTLLFQTQHLTHQMPAITLRRRDVFPSPGWAERCLWVRRLGARGRLEGSGPRRPGRRGAGRAPPARRVSTRRRGRPRRPGTRRLRAPRWTGTASASCGSCSPGWWCRRSWGTWGRRWWC